MRLHCIGPMCMFGLNSFSIYSFFGACNMSLGGSDFDRDVAAILGQGDQQEQMGTDYHRREHLTEKLRTFKALRREHQGLYFSQSY